MHATKSEDIPLEQLKGPLPFDVELGGDGEWVTNVPHTVIHHSPTGFAWGYAGSGPADLALNILNAFVPPGTDGQPPVACYRGEASATAMNLHQAFKQEFLATLDQDGGYICSAVIEDWIEAMREKHEQAMRDVAALGNTEGRG